MLGLPLPAFGSLWGALALPWGALGLLWDPLGRLWAALGPLGGPMTSFGGPFGVLGDSLGGPLGVPWGALGCLGRFSLIFRKWDAQFRANVSICTRLRIESSLPELAYGARGARGNGSQSAAQTPPGHTRRGLGLRELNKLPQTIGNSIGN